jgi:capsular exopolysaccharide synthesis family protein
MEGSRTARLAARDDWDSQPALTLRALLAAARRQAIWLAGTSGLIVALTILYTMRQRPVYEASTTLRLAEHQNAGNQPDLFAALSAQSTIETEVEILRSRQVAEDVVDALGLQVDVVEPIGVSRTALFKTLRAKRDAATGTYVVRREPETFSVTAPDGHEVRAPYGTSVNLGGLELEPLTPGAGVPNKTIDLSVAPTSGVAEGVRGTLRVTRPQPTAAIVVLSYRSIDPALASGVVNAVAHSYIARRNEMQKQQAHAGIQFLEAQVQAIGAELHEAESALEQFRRTRFVIDPEAQAGDAVRRLADFRAEREQLAAERNELGLLLARARGAADSAVGWTVFASSPSLAKNQALSGIVQQLSTVEAERTRLGTWRTAADPDVATLQHTISLLRSRLVDLAASQLRSLDAQAQALDSTLARADARLQRIPEVQVSYARLRRQVDLDGQLYTLLQTRLKESQISEAMEVANIQVVDPALVPTTPLGARRLMNLVFGTAAGLLLGLVVAFGREANDTRIRSRDEVVRLTELPLLAAIPRIPAVNGRRHEREPAERIEKRLVTRHAPRSPGAEAYRALRTSLAFSIARRKTPLKTLVVTSAEPEDGKTTTAVNLAITLAEQGHRVMLLAADQRRPVLHKVLHTERSPGLSDVLSGTAALEVVIHSIQLPEHASGSLDFIAAGRAVPNPAELLGSVAARDLLSKLADRYDHVIIDTPPLGVVTDAAVVATIADGLLIVARMGSTHGEILRHAVAELESIGARVVGAVLTDVHHAEDRYGHRYGYHYTESSDDHASHNGGR